MSYSEIPLPTVCGASHSGSRCIHMRADLLLLARGGKCRVQPNSTPNTLHEKPVSGGTKKSFSTGVFFNLDVYFNVQLQPRATIMLGFQFDIKLIKSLHFFSGGLTTCNTHSLFSLRANAAWCLPNCNHTFNKSCSSVLKGQATKKRNLDSSRVLVI